MITILTENDLERLIKKGAIDVPATNISYKNDIAKAIDDLFESTEPFEFSEERVLLQYPDSIGNRINIIDLESVIPLDDNGYRHYSKYQDSIPLSKPETTLSKSVWEQLKTNCCIHNSRMGVRLFRKFCGLQPENTGFENQIAESVAARLSMAHVEIPPEKRNPWIMLITYDRHEPYETDSRGYFLDIEEIMYYLRTSLMGWQDNPIGNTKSTRAILELQETKRWEPMVKDLKDNDLSTKLIDGVEKEFGSVFIPLLYLYLKEQLKEFGKRDIPTNILQNIESIKNKYPQDFDIVATLIGGFMGYENLRKSCLGKTLIQHVENIAQTSENVSMVPVNIPNSFDWEGAFDKIVLKNKHKKTRKKQLELFKMVFSHKGKLETLSQAIINNDYDLFENCFEAFEDKKVKEKLFELFKYMKTQLAITKVESSQMQLNL